MRLRARFAGPLRAAPAPQGTSPFRTGRSSWAPWRKVKRGSKRCLEGDDVRHTARAASFWARRVERQDDGIWVVTGAGGFSQPSETIDCGNSGTGARLLMGAAASYKLSARFDGDQSLRKRPMNRVIAPLSQMGARFDGKQNCLPLIVHGGALKGITYRSPMSSAQVKSAVLLAG
jgi:3-phosphoshikimate 1-carboxyvinyltransferase